MYGVASKMSRANPTFNYQGSVAYYFNAFYLVNKVIGYFYSHDALVFF